MTLTFDLLTPKSIGHILDSWGASVWSFMIIGGLQSQLSSGNHFQITMRHDLDLWPFDPKINRAHPWLMGSKCMKFHDHRWITESVIVRKLVWRTDRQTDGQTDWRTDRVQTYSPLRFHQWGTNKDKRMLPPIGSTYKFLLSMAIIPYYLSTMAYLLSCTYITEVQHFSNLIQQKLILVHAHWQLQYKSVPK